VVYDEFKIRWAGCGHIIIARHAGTLRRYVLVLNYRSGVANITPGGTLVSSGMSMVGAYIFKYSLKFLNYSLMIVKHGVISAA
jgi:hypothetical protein